MCFGYFLIMLFKNQKASFLKNNPDFLLPAPPYPLPCIELSNVPPEDGQSTPPTTHPSPIYLPVLLLQAAEFATPGLK